MRPSVLVVEDYADLRSAIVTALERQEYACDDAQTAEDAIDKLRHHHYEAILLSPTIPITEDPVIHFLDEFQPGERPKVILMTEPGATEETQHVLLKPFGNAQLFAELRGK
jgi:DNA-binding response OmpR family regulator